MDTIQHIVTFYPFEAQTIVRIVVMMLLLVCSALISGSETAYFSLSPSNINQIRRENSPSGQAIIKLLSMQDYLLATILIINNLVNICIVIICNSVIDNIVHFQSSVWEFVTKVVIVTFILLLFGEIMPKIFAAYNSLKFARIVSRPLLVLKKIVYPISFLLIHSGNRIGESIRRKRVNISMDELSNAIEITEHQSSEEKKMLSGIINFASTEVEQIMKPRIDMVALDATSDFDEVRRVIIESGFSRIPIYEESLDQIKGVLYVKDMLPYVAMNEKFEWQHFLRKAYFVPEHKKINDLLEEFQANKVHMAIVVDEYGSTQGLISLEDILEEIVGEIGDESDRVEPVIYKKIDDDRYEFEGKTHLNDFVRIIGLSEDYFAEVEGGAETVAGLMLELKRDFLKKDESVIYKNITFRVLSIEGRRIEIVKVKILR